MVFNRRLSGVTGDTPNRQRADTHTSARFEIPSIAPPFAGLPPTIWCSDACLRNLLVSATKSLCRETNRSPFAQYVLLRNQASASDARPRVSHLIHHRFQSANPLVDGVRISAIHLHSREAP